MLKMIPIPNTWLFWLLLLASFFFGIPTSDAAFLKNMPSGAKNYFLTDLSPVKSPKHQDSCWVPRQNPRDSSSVLTVFISEDPKRDGWNWYGYSNDPVNYNDPSGYFTEIDDAKGEVMNVVFDGTTNIIASPFRDGQRLQGPGQWVGNSFAEDSFIAPDGPKKEKAVGRVFMGSSIDNYISQHLSKEYGYFETWYKSTGGGEFDLKSDSCMGGSYAGHQFQGKYMTMREAGNMLAGMNAARLGMDFEDFQKGSGALHTNRIPGVIIYKLFGTTYGKAPEWGEIPYQHLRSKYGYDLYNQGFR